MDPDPPGTNVSRVVEAGLSLIPGAGLLSPWVQPFAEKIALEVARSRSECLRLVVQETNMSREDIEANLDQNPQLLTLTNRVLWVAGHSGQDRVLRILAGFLADAIRQPALADEVTALMGSLESLSEHHIRVLELCSTPAPDAAANEPNPLAQYWNEKQVLEHAGFRSELVSVALRGLAGAGLLDDRKNDTWDSVLTPMFQVTEMGNAVLDALRKVTPTD